MKKLEGGILFLAILFAIFLPPAAVVLKREEFDMHFWINIILCLLAWFPATLHAIYILFFNED